MTLSERRRLKRDEVGDEGSPTCRHASATSLQYMFDRGSYRAKGRLATQSLTQSDLDLRTKYNLQEMDKFV